MDFIKPISIEEENLINETTQISNKKENEINEKIQNKNKIMVLEDKLLELEKSLNDWKDLSKIQLDEKERTINELRKTISENNKEIQNNAKEIKLLKDELSEIKNSFYNKVTRLNEDNNKLIIEKRDRDVILYLKDIYQNFMNNNDEKDYDIKILTQDEIINKMQDNKLDKIILMNENTSKEFKKIMKYDLIYQYLDSNLDKQNEYFNNNKKDFIQIYNILRQQKGINIPLINSFNECRKDILDKNKFFILYLEKITDIFPKEKDINTYYFKYHYESYIFFGKEKKIVQIIKDNNYKQNGLYILKEYEINEKELLKFIIFEINKNKINNFNLNDIKQCYIINNNYIMMLFLEKEDIKKVSAEIIEPLKGMIYYKYNNKKEYKYEYPTNFEIMEKEKYEKIFDFLTKKNKNINIKIIYEILYVNWENKTKNNQNGYNYIGLMNKNIFKDIIFFYLVNDDKYSFRFLLHFLNENYMNEEINNIKYKGIGKYLDEMGININKAEQEYLINNDLIEVGLFKNNNLNIEEKNNYIFEIPEYSKGLEFDSSDIFNGIILCLINLKLFKDLFTKSNIYQIFGKNNKIDNFIYSKYFFKIILDLWNYDIDENKYNNLYISFKEQIKIEKKFPKIFENNKKLVESIILGLHNEYIVANGGKIKIKQFEYSYNNIDHFYENYESEIQKLFFFDLTLSYTCPINNKHNHFQYYPDCSREIQLEKIEKNNKKKIINIYDILNGLIYDNTTCSKCNKVVYITVKRLFYKCSPCLIIILIKERNKNYNFKFEMKELIDIKDYYYNELKPLEHIEYKLISFVKNSFTFFKSFVNNKWYKCQGKIPQEIDSCKINKVMDIPDIMFYIKI